MRLLRTKSLNPNLQFFEVFNLSISYILKSHAIHIRETESGGPLRMVEKGPKEISKFGRKMNF